MAPKKKEEIQQNLKEVEEALTFNLEDIDGIGNVKLKKMHDNGIFEASDLIVRGPKELSVLLDLGTDQTTKMIEDAKEYLRSKGVVRKAIFTGREYYNYETLTRNTLSSGVDGFDEIMTGGFESGSLTELYGEFGSGKTQFCFLATIMAQLPYKRKCHKCLEVFDDQKIERCPRCDVKTTIVGGLSEEGKPCRIIYVDTEGTFKPKRIEQLIYERGLVKTKEQTKLEEKRKEPKEPLNDEEREKALKFLDNILLFKVSNAGHQLLVGEELGTYINQKDQPPVRLIIVDSITATFRLDFLGRGEISERQMYLTRHVKHISRLCDTYNIVGIITNQVLKSPTGFGDPNVASGGTVLAHTSSHRIYLKKSGKKVVAIIIDSPNHAKSEAILELTNKGVENASA